MFILKDSVVVQCCFIPPPSRPCGVSNNSKKTRWWLKHPFQHAQKFFGFNHRRKEGYPHPRAGLSQSGWDASYFTNQYAPISICYQWPRIGLGFFGAWDHRLAVISSRNLAMISVSIQKPLGRYPQEVAYSTINSTCHVQKIMKLQLYKIILA